MRNAYVIGILYMTLIGTESGFSETEKAKSFICPNSQFEKEGTTGIIKDNMLSAFRSRLNSEQKNSATGVGKGEGQIEELKKQIAYLERCTDPFLAEDCAYVTFSSKDQTKDIVGYYENLFKSSGWDREQRILPIKETDFEGDWVGAYHKEGKRVHLHIRGSPEAGRRKLIIFRFSNVKPSDFFSQDYKTTAE